MVDWMDKWDDCMDGTNELINWIIFGRTDLAAKKQDSGVLGKICLLVASSSKFLFLQQIPPSILHSIGGQFYCCSSGNLTDGTRTAAASDWFKPPLAKVNGVSQQIKRLNNGATTKHRDNKSVQLDSDKLTGC